MRRFPRIAIMLFLSSLPILCVRQTLAFPHLVEAISLKPRINTDQKLPEAAALFHAILI